MVFLGYVGDMIATSTTIDEQGFLHTGDIGLIDDDDEVFIVDRVKEIIKFKGFQANFTFSFTHFMSWKDWEFECQSLKPYVLAFLSLLQVPPAELEAILLSHPSILDSACVP